MVGRGSWYDFHRADIIQSSNSLHWGNYIGSHRNQGGCAFVKTIDARREKVTDPSPDNAFWTTPEELTAAILYLLSEEAGTVNGARIPLYGSF